MPETPEPPPVIETVNEPPTYPQSAPHGMNYQEVADKIGFVPNVRLSDNLIQGGAALGGLLAGGLVGLLFKWPISESGGISGGICGVLGLLAGTFAAGLYLMIRNLQRKR